MARGDAFVAGAFGGSAFGGTRKKRRSPLAHYRFHAYSNHRRAVTAGASSDQEEFDGQVRDYEDDIAAGVASRIAGVSGRIASSETRFPLVEMELDMSGYDQRMAAREGAKLESISTASGEMAS
ncbi:hypothetical protein AXG93_3612s1230 [Marchantia polymorpha subsp. ruderalis]|uniref:Uncharacterized protein n=1 Tax=Marchantia polymorpha subsp. ruderalis TaxID=1480154 RepID=A0A176WB55_MARPO|nr:hypothetical protein AXG93_3612s1230 [Marchantia polymorpha subsp. ruderalis]